MQKRSQIILRAFLKAALLALLFATVWGCERISLNQSFPSLDRSLPDESSKNVQITEYLNDNVDNVMIAERVERFVDRRILYAYAVKISSYNEDTSLKSVVLADTAIVDDARNMIFANGKVNLSSENGSIQSRKIVWDRNVDEITAPERVILTRDMNVLKGKNLKTNSIISYAEMDEVSAEGIVSEKDIDW